MGHFLANNAHASLLGPFVVVEWALRNGLILSDPLPLCGVELPFVIGGFLVETVKGKGYRLNPSIRIVLASQIGRGTGHGTDACHTLYAASR